MTVPDTVNVFWAYNAAGNKNIHHIKNWVHMPKNIFITIRFIHCHQPVLTALRKYERR
jgi:hypothetical protein